jgi:periplasmic protein TonB
MQIDYKLDDSRNKGMVVSAIIHAVLLLLFFFLLAWKQPDPPTPGSPGIEINFGLDAAGMGPNNEQPISENSTQPVQEEVQEESQPTPSEEASAVTSDMASDYKVEDKKDPKPVKETPKEPVKEVKKNSEVVKETKTPTTQTTKTTDGRSLMGNGDKNTAGDQGDPKGNLDARALYGNNGEGNGGDGKGGNGTSLNMTGWKWLSPPRVNDNSSESGKLVFKISVDEDGNIVSVIPVEKQVSSTVAKYYEDAVWKLEFEKTKDFTKAAQNSTGFITFIIRSK